MEKQYLDQEKVAKLLRIESSDTKLTGLFEEIKSAHQKTARKQLLDKQNKRLDEGKKTTDLHATSVQIINVREQEFTTISSGKSVDVLVNDIVKVAQAFGYKTIRTNYADGENTIN